MAFDIPDKRKPTAKAPDHSHLPPIPRAAPFKNGQPAPDPKLVGGRDDACRLTYAILCGLMRHGHLHRLPNVKNWVPPVRNMLKHTSLSKREILQVLRWYFQHGLGREYVPKAFCASTLVEKFGAIRAAYIEDNGQPLDWNEGHQPRPQWVWGDTASVPVPPDILDFDKQTEAWELYHAIVEADGQPDPQLWNKYKAICSGH
jgi:hypothetical protein